MMNEREAWTAIADVMEMLEGMPPRFDGTLTESLCSVLIGLNSYREINEHTHRQMHARIRAELQLRHWSKDSGFLLKPGLWKPRAKLARRFAKECEA